MIDLEAIKKRVDAATPGPWNVYDNNNIVANHPHKHLTLMGDVEHTAIAMCFRKSCQHCNGFPVDNNLQFISHSRTDIPALISEVERLRKIELIATELAMAKTIAECQVYWNQLYALVGPKALSGEVEGK